MQKQKPIIVESNVSIRNTLQTAADPMDGGTGGAELPIETVFGAPEGTYNLTTTTSQDDVEFVNYLEGLYSIDLSQDEINFELVAPAGHPVL